MMKPVPYFINTDGQTFGSTALSVSRNFGEKWSYSGVSHDVLYVAGQGFYQVLPGA